MMKSKSGLRFVKGNAKLSATYIFNLPAGWSCPGAERCLSRADPDKGGVKDGKRTEFRCYAASEEARYANIRKSRWGNYNAARLLLEEGGPEALAAALDKALPKAARKVRVHSSGDMFSLAYLDAWLLLARRRPEVTFYFYTKSLQMWALRLEELGSGHEPGSVANVVPTASRGGKWDHLIGELGLREARVFYSYEEAAAAGLEIDHDDGHASSHGGDFGLILHGAQPKGSDAGKALYALRKAGEWGYGEKATARRVALATL